MGVSRAVRAVLTSAVPCSEEGALEVTGGQEGPSGCVVPGETNCHSPPWPSCFSLLANRGSRAQSSVLYFLARL